MQTKYDELARLAEAATPGPWHWNTRSEVGPRIESDDQSDGMMDAVAYIDSQNADANRAYIAAANPATIKALLADRNALAEALEKIVAWPDGGNHYGQSNIKQFASAALARVKEGA